MVKRVEVGTTALAGREPINLQASSQHESRPRRMGQVRGVACELHCDGA
jgi:hypothetical protein